MHNPTILSSKDITELINLKGIEKGIEATHIEIENGIIFSGRLFGKINSNFSGHVYIKEFYNNRIVLETKNLNISKLGKFKGANILLLKSLLKFLGEDYINIIGSNIIIKLDKYDGEIKDVYIKDKLLYIIGTNLNMYLDA